MNKRIVIAGGSGFLGRNLRRHLSERGWSVQILTRNPVEDWDVEWDARTLGAWTREIDGADALINMAGRTVDCRYTQANRIQILNSRIDSTRVLHQAVEIVDSPPRAWLNSSTSTIYNDTRGDAPANSEFANNIGEDFSMGVARAWESEFFRIEHRDTVQTALRTAIVMGADGGAFQVMSQIARWGLCSPQGSGDQWISWIHVDDFCRAVSFLIEKPTEGCVNLCSPNPVQNREFNQLLKKRTKPWIVLPQPVWLLKLGAVFMQTEVELVLKSRKVFPERLKVAGFDFNYPTADEMIDSLMPSK